MRCASVVTITVRGTPAPQGSKSFKGLSGAGRAILAESSEKVRPWRQDVKAAAEEWISSNQATLFHGRSTARGAVFDGPVVCRMVFTLKKPSSSPKTRRTFPSRKPDLDKLLRSTLVDRLAKVFPGEDPESLPVPGVRIEVREVEA